jgi:DNA (cytosine-5)-methyltransferase 1
MTKRVIKFIDLFAGLGGTRIGLEEALEERGLSGKCVFTSEIKPHAITIYKKNFNNENVHGDITKINESEIPDLVQRAADGGLWIREVLFSSI